MQTILNEWERVSQEIEKSKIKRYPYKRLLGESLTNYILRNKEEGLNSSQVIGAVLREQGIKIYLFENPQEKENLLKNIEIGVYARFSEERQRGRI